MIQRICNSVFKTDNLPIVGGASGALLPNASPMFPNPEHLIYTVIIAAVGATVGYLIKLLLDYLFDKCK